MISDVIHQILAASLIICAVIVFGTVMYSHIEGWSSVDSVYFVVTSAFTVGYGDITVSPDHRILTGVFLICVCTLTLASSSVIGKGLIQIIQDRAAFKKEKRITISIGRKVEKLRGEGVKISDEDIADIKSELNKITEELKDRLASDKDL
ncbi:MAG: potassium channel family protein [Candidatus Methanogranum gryphiswaldense]|nr:MAG: potassium channel family protein [Candidatus Methanogranum sp. U3.2.1]